MTRIPERGEEQNQERAQGWPALDPQPATPVKSAAAEELQPIPKIELHVHLEGSLTPDRLRRLADKYQTELHDERHNGIDEVYAFQTFQEFLQAYRVCCQHLKQPEDYAQVAADLFRQLAEQRCVYVEVIMTPSICTRFGLPAVEVIEALLEQAAGASRSGLQVRWIFDTVRQWGPDHSWQTLEWALQYRQRGVVAISIGGDESSQPASLFREIFESAEKQGLHRTAHAGEICGARSVWLAIEELRAERIGHGVRALEDSQLVEYLARAGIALDVSITSNLKTGAVDRERQHPIEEIARRGLPFTLNSDDPGLFQTTLLREWEVAAGILGWSAERFVDLMRRTLQYTFLTSAEREQIGRLLM